MPWRVNTQYRCSNITRRLKCPVNLIPNKRPWMSSSVTTCIVPWSSMRVLMLFNTRRSFSCADWSPYHSTWRRRLARPSSWSIHYRAVCWVSWRLVYTFHFTFLLKVTASIPYWNTCPTRWSSWSRMLEGDRMTMPINLILEPTRSRWWPFSRR